MAPALEMDKPQSLRGSSNQEIGTAARGEVEHEGEIVSASSAPRCPWARSRPIAHETLATR